jgi:hypothetical protein
MAKITLTLDIPDDKVDEVLDAFEGMAPIPKVRSDPNDPASALVPQYTRAQWPRVCLVNHVISMVRRWRIQQRIASAEQPDMSDIGVS